ncbi:MAG: nitrogen fixation protein NifZ [Pseudomonadota bacterium]
MIEELVPGDIVYAATTIKNDGSLPGLSEGAVVAEKGQRGVIINTGHLEENPNKIIILVRFERDGEPGNLGPAIGCWKDELSVEGF